MEEAWGKERVKVLRDRMDSSIWGAPRGRRKNPVLEFKAVLVLILPVLLTPTPHPVLSKLTGHFNGIHSCRH